MFLVPIDVEKLAETENEKGGICQHCGQYFKKLNQHIMYTHEKNKPWQCDECDFSHALERGLKGVVI